MTALKRFLMFTGRYIVFNLQCAMEYRLSFIAQILFMFLNDVFLLFFWWVFFQTFQSVQGWEMTDILLLYAFGAGGFGLGYTICGNAPRLSQIVAEGQLDYYLALPRHPLWHLLISRMHVSAIGDLFFGMAVYFLTDQPSPGGFLVLMVLMVASAAILVCFTVLAHCLTFFWGNSEGFAQFYANILVTLALYPRNVFTSVVQFALFTIIPVGFMTYLPAQIMRDFDLAKIAMVLAFAALSAWMANRIFAWGLKRYESGNLLAARG